MFLRVTFWRVIKMSEKMNNDIINNNTRIDMDEVKKKFGELEVSSMNRFSDMKWKCNGEHNPDRYRYIDFNRITPYVGCFNINMVKAWLIYLLKKNTFRTVSNYYSHLAIFINASKGFRLDQVANVQEYLLNKNTLTPFKNEYSLVRHVVNFIEFSEIEVDEQYLLTLNEAIDIYKYESKHRVLPSSSSILKFSYYLEEYYNELISDSESYNTNLIKYYPIFLWWKITLVIPMRISEFSYMSRNCLIEENEKYFITFKRIKYPYNQEIIEINKETRNMIKHYMLLTNKYKSKTLISYLAEINAKGKPYLYIKKNDIDYYNTDNFLNLLKKFYNEIIEKKYSIYFQDEEKLSPNDTRHLSFISLMMQGYDPHLISKLGGHSTIEKQYEYSYHPEFWIDNQMYILKRKLDYENLYLNRMKNLDNSLINNCLSPGTSNFKGKLEIGYCSDDQQRCESLSTCILCSHWRIDFDELIDRKKEILLQLKQQRSNLIDMVSTYLEMIKSLYKENEVSDNANVDFSSRTLKNKIEVEIQKLYKLNNILEEGERN